MKSTFNLRSECYNDLFGAGQIKFGLERDHKHTKAAFEMSVVIIQLQTWRQYETLRLYR
jgi:hypothetical protein